MEEMLIVASVISVFVSVAVEGAKRVFPGLPKRYTPAVALVLGLLLGLAYGYFIPDKPIGFLLWAGGVAGFAASGLYKFGGNLMTSKKTDE